MKTELNRDMLHVFIIPDGNRRWAKKQSLLSFKGHTAGYERLKEITENIWDFGVTHLTIWALSRDNIVKRSRIEVEFIFSIFDRAIDEVRASKKFSELDICFRAVGEWREMFPPRLSKKIFALEEETKDRKKYLCTIGLAYDGVWDIVRGIENARKSDPPEVVAADTLHNFLPSGFLPDIDVMIRTGGESHLSAGAFMWQMRNAQLYFLDMFWPEFSTDDLSRIIADFRKRERRFGK